MRWEADVNIGGPVGSMGQRVLQPIVNQQVTNVLNSLEKHVNEASASEVHTGAEPGGDPMQPVEAAAVAEEVEDVGDSAHSSSAPEPDEGTSGAEEGVNPLAPEAYEPDPEGPTTSTAKG
jgi:hypothetical protein